MHFFTHIPGAGDASWFLWQFWWFKHALLDLQQSPYTTNLIYYPLQDVPVMAQTPVNELFTLPLQVAFNVVILNNLLFILTYLLSGYFTYLLGVMLTRRRYVAFVGGMIFAFCSYRGIRSLGHMSLLTTQWMPLAMLLIMQCIRRPSWPRGVAAGVAVALVVLSSPYYVGLFLFPVVLVGLIALIFWCRDLVRQKALWMAASVGGIVCLILVVPPYFHYLQLEAELYTLINELEASVTTYSADLLSWWLPSGLHPLWLTYTAPIYASFSTPNLTETTVFVGYIPLLLLLFSFGLRRPTMAVRYWQLLAVVSWLLSLGPTLHFGGQALFAWLPYRFLLLMPGFSSFRTPSRAGVTTALALSIISMLVLHHLIGRYRRAPWSLLIPLGALLIFVNNLVMFPFRGTDARIPAIYTEVAEDPAPIALLDLPAGEFFQQNYNFFGEVSMAMYYQSYHQKPIVSGYLGRRPPRLAEPEHTLPFVRHFFHDQSNQPPIHFPTRPFLPESFQPGEIEQGAWLLQKQGIGYVVFHDLSTTTKFYPGAIGVLNQTLGLPVQVDGVHRLYRVQPPPYHAYGVPVIPFRATIPRYDQAFSPGVVDEQGYVRTILADGEISFTLPFTGTWSLQGEWVGPAASSAATQLDDTPLSLHHDLYTNTTLAWQTTMTMTQGIHRLQVALPAEQPVTATEACATLCLRNFTVRLVRPVLATTQKPLATFVNETNQTADLLTMSFLTTPATTAPALQQAWLMTAWRLDEATYAQAQRDPQKLPALYVHFTTPDGQIRRQSDHPLGERRLVLTNAPIVVDVIALPNGLEDLAMLEVRLGLWYPTRNAYFWSTDPTQVDEGNRFNLGVLGKWRQEIDPPAIPIDPARNTTFMLDGAEEPYMLLQARLIDDENSGELPSLLTTWRTPYTFDQHDNINLRLQVSTVNGALITEIEHRLGADNLLDGETQYMIDHTVLTGLPTEPEKLVFWIGLREETANRPFTVTATEAQIQTNLVRLGTGAEIASE